MDITPQDTTTQPISDDQELAKALAGVLPDEPSAANIGDTAAGMQFEETPAPMPSSPTSSPAPSPIPDPVAIQEEPVVPDNTPIVPEFEAPESVTFPEPPSFDEVSSQSNTSYDTFNLDDVKKDAILQLRPLIDHIDLPAEEKFDTYLLLIRSTDDATLIAPAHLAAQNISDEKRKAEALLDIIKEIDYLSKKD